MNTLQDAVQAALEAHGFHAVNLGGNTPAATFEAGIKAHSPALVWISVNHIESADLAQKSIQEIADSSRERGIQSSSADEAVIDSTSNLQATSSSPALCPI